MFESLVRELCRAAVTVMCMLLALSIYDWFDQWRS